MDRFFQVYNFVHNLRKCRIRAVLSKFRLKPSWDEIAKTVLHVCGEYHKRYGMDKISTKSKNFYRPVK